MNAKGTAAAPVRATAESSTCYNLPADRPIANKPAVYLPAAVDALLCDEFPPGRQRCYSRFFAHSIAVQAWLGRADADGFSRLDSRILRQSIPGRKLPEILEVLRSAGAIEESPHAAGRRCRGYRFAAGFSGRPVRRAIDTNRLARKVTAARDRWSAEDPTPPDLAAVLQRRAPVLEAMRSNIARLQFADPPADVAEQAIAKGKDPDHAAYAAEVVARNDDLRVIVDAFGRRCHTIATRIAEPIRQALTFDGRPTVEVDVSECQPLILAAIFRSPERAAELVGVEVPRPLERDLASFTEAAEAGVVYKQIAEDLSIEREEAKQRCYRDVLFCKPCVNSTCTRAFKGYWPTVFEALVKLKCAVDYKVVAKLLQRAESSIMIDGVAARLAEAGEPFLTIHDAALIVQNRADFAAELIRAEFEPWGVRPTVKKEGG